MSSFLSEASTSVAGRIVEWAGATLAKTNPMLLVLDPMVRLHRGDE